MRRDLNLNDCDQDMRRLSVCLSVCLFVCVCVTAWPWCGPTNEKLFEENWPAQHSWKGRGCNATQVVYTYTYIYTKPQAPCIYSGLAAAYYTADGWQDKKISSTVLRSSVLRGLHCLTGRPCACGTGNERHCSAAALTHIRMVASSDADAIM